MTNCEHHCEHQEIGFGRTRFQCVRKATKFFVFEHHPDWKNNPGITLKTVTARCDNHRLEDLIIGSMRQVSEEEFVVHQIMES